jgi:type I restriction enzyme S subunit
MMINKKKVPEIRFKSFSEEWEEKKLGEIGKTYTGLSGKTKKDFGYGKARFVTYMNVFSNPIAKFNSMEPIEIDNKQNEVEFGDVFFTTSSETPEEVGMSSVWMNKGKNIYLNSFCFGYRPEKIFNLYYLAYMLRSPYIRKKIIFLAQGISRYNISKNKVMEISIPIPNIEEQTKIGNYFQKLDNLIEQKEQKQQKLKQIKKAMLNKMFPKNGEKIPEIRFKGFSGEWEEKKLGEIVYRYDNLRVPISASNRISGNTPYYGANGIQDYVKGFTHNGEFLLVAEDGANDLKNYPVQYVNGKIWVNNHTHVIQAKKDISNTRFLKYSISKIHIEPFLVGGGRAKLNANVMMNIKLFLPKLQEQTKIGNYFQKLDKLIELEKKELEKLKDIKKSLLNKMFI